MTHMDTGEQPQPATETTLRGRRPTVEEAEAILTLVRGGWLTLTLDLSDA